MELVITKGKFIESVFHELIREPLELAWSHRVQSEASIVCITAGPS